MAVMSPQPRLPLVPDGVRPVGAAAAIVEDDDGGRVYVHGNLAYAWDADDAPGRRFAAVSLTRIKAATQLQVAAAFAVNPATLRRWEARCSDAGMAGLLNRTQRPQTQVEAHTRHGRRDPPVAGGWGVLPDRRRHGEGVEGQCPQRAQAYRHRRRR
jgi:hypothetical protein